jgi:hypothetical protein
MPGYYLKDRAKYNICILKITFLVRLFSMVYKNLFSGFVFYQGMFFSGGPKSFISGFFIIALILVGH